MLWPFSISYTVPKLSHTFTHFHIHTHSYMHTEFMPAIRKYRPWFLTHLNFKDFTPRMKCIGKVDITECFICTRKMSNGYHWSDDKIALEWVSAWGCCGREKELCHANTNLCILYGQMNLCGIANSQNWANLLMNSIYFFKKKNIYFDGI